MVRLQTDLAEPRFARPGVDAFTTGSAAFAGSLQPQAGPLITQLQTVVSQWLASPTQRTAENQETHLP